MQSRGLIMPLIKTSYERKRKYMVRNCGGGKRWRFFGVTAVKFPLVLAAVNQLLSSCALTTSMGMGTPIGKR